MKRVLLWVSVVSASVLFLLVAAWYQTLAYLQSPAFSDKLAEQLRERTHAAAVSLHSPLRIEGDRLSDEGLSIEKAGKLRSARAGRIHMEIDRAALLSRRLHIRKVSVEEGELVFSAGSPSPKKAPKKNHGTSETPTAAAKKHGADALPRQAADSSTAGPAPLFNLRGWALDAAECKDTDIAYTHNGNEFRLQGCTLTSTPHPKGGWQHLAENGRLHTPFALLRGAGVKTATVRQNDEGLSLTDCRITLSPGEMRLRAHQDALTEKWSASLAINKASIAPMLHGDWQKRVSGELYGKATFTGEKGSLTAGEGSLSLQQGVLEALPFLSELPSKGGYPYRHLELEQASCRITYPYSAPELNIGESWLFNNIRVEAKNKLLLAEGYVILGTDGSLGGTLNIGLPRQMLAGLPLNNLMQGLFHEQESSEFLWVTINLSGTLDMPEEDLSVRCAALLKNALPQAAGQTAATAEQMLRLLLHPAAPAQPAEGEPETPQPLRSAAESVQKGIQGVLKSLF